LTGIELDLTMTTVTTTPKKAIVSIDELPDLLTVREVADILRVSPLTIKRWGKRGKLPAIRINTRGDRRYKKEAVLWLLGIQQKTV
jgi:excisionase family DNA binding protein